MTGVNPWLHLLLAHKSHQTRTNSNSFIVASENKGTSHSIVGSRGTLVNREVISRLTNRSLEDTVI